VRHNVVTSSTLWCPLILLLLIGDGGLTSPAWAQTTAPPTSPIPTTQTTTPQPDVALPVDLERIKQGLTIPVKIRIDDGRVRFYAEVTAPRGPTFKEMTVNFDLMKGGVPGAGMTHQEFLGIVTPKLRYYSGLGEGIKALAWGVGAQVAWWTIRKLYKELDETKDARRAKEIRDQIDRELAALRGGR
jgi:hypothetical protein